MLRVIQAFGDYVVGDSITDSAAASVLETDQAAFVVAIAEPETAREPDLDPAPDTKAAKPTPSAS